jgi:hypothetical protein
VTTSGLILIFLGPSNRLTDHLVRRAVLAVLDELLQLFSPGRLAELDRAVDRQRPVSQGFYQSRVGGLEDRLHIADVKGANTSRRS